MAVRRDMAAWLVLVSSVMVSSVVALHRLAQRGAGEGWFKRIESELRQQYVHSVFT
jgi:hypothetical protein